MHRREQIDPPTVVRSLRERKTGVPSWNCVGALIAVAILSLCLLNSLLAQSVDKASDDPQSTRASKATTDAPKRDAKRRNTAITPEREAAVLSFVQRNHAELVGLLGYLKASQPEEYDRALRDIFRTTERLAQIQERDPLQYELEVAAWSAQSHVQLLAAELQMNSSEDLIKQLRQALQDQNESRLTLIKHERQKAADRLTKLDNDIARLEKDGDTFIDRQLKTLTRAAAEGRPTKVTPKAAAKTKKSSPAKNPTN